MRHFWVELNHFAGIWNNHGNVVYQVNEVSK